MGCILLYWLMQRSNLFSCKTREIELVTILTSFSAFFSARKSTNYSSISQQENQLISASNLD